MSGKRILVTRAREQAAEFVAQLEKLGAQVVIRPMVLFDDPEDFTALDAAIRSISAFDWLFFTSQNAVTYFVKRCRTLEAEIPKTLKMAAVGPKTAEAAKSESLSTAYVPAAFRGEAMVMKDLKGKKILYPASSLARGEFPRALRALGAEVTEVVAYRTLSPEPATPGADTQGFLEPLDVIAFFSPSAFRNFVEEVGVESLRNAAQCVALAAIGPTTAAAIREAGLPVAVESSQATSAALATAICNYFAPRRGPERNSP